MALTVGAAQRGRAGELSIDERIVFRPSDGDPFQVPLDLVHDFRAFKWTWISGANPIGVKEATVGVVAMRTRREGEIFFVLHPSRLHGVAKALKAMGLRRRWSLRNRTLPKSERLPRR
jgi:hypothetical protein